MKCDIVGEILLGIGARNFAIVLVHQLIEADIAALDARLRTPPKSALAVSITMRISGASDVSTPLSAISSISPSERSSSLATLSSACFRSVDDRSTPLARLSEFVDHHVAMGEIGGGRLGDAVDLAADRR